MKWKRVWILFQAPESLNKAELKKLKNEIWAKDNYQFPRHSKEVSTERQDHSVDVLSEETERDLEKYVEIEEVQSVFWVKIIAHTLIKGWTMRISKSSDFSTRGD